MVFTTQCPQCGKILWFASNLTGKLTICPACGAVMRLTPPPEAVEQAQAPEASTVVAEAPPPMGSADEVNQETGTPVAAEPIEAEPVAAETIPPEEIPAAVEESSLAHQAAVAAAGEVHVEVEESDLVGWSAQPEGAVDQPPLPPTAPPEWSPAPLSDLGAAQQPANQEMVWI